MTTFLNAIKEVQHRGSQGVRHIDEVKMAESISTSGCIGFEATKTFLPLIHGDSREVIGKLRHEKPKQSQPNDPTGQPGYCRLLAIWESKSPRGLAGYR